MERKLEVIIKVERILNIVKDNPRVVAFINLLHTFNFERQCRLCGQTNCNCFNSEDSNIIFDTSQNMVRSILEKKLSHEYVTTLFSGESSAYTEEDIDNTLNDFHKLMEEYVNIARN
jgi:hypothetical protein